MGRWTAEGVARARRLSSRTHLCMDAGDRSLFEQRYGYHRWRLAADRFGDSESLGLSHLCFNLGFNMHYAFDETPTEEV